jgi:hypothetical protein
MLFAPACSDESQQIAKTYTQLRKIFPVAGAVMQIVRCRVLKVNGYTSSTRLFALRLPPTVNDV